MVRLLFLLMVIGTAACSASKEQTIDLHDYRIVYNVLVDSETGDYDILSMNTDGTDVKNLSNSPGVDWAYTSHDGLIYFLSDRGQCANCYFLYSMDGSGGSVRQISETRMADSWMSVRKSGTEIMVRPHSSVDSAFHVIDEDGVLMQRVLTGLPYASDPQFIDDEDRMVFRGGNAASKREEGFDEALYLMNLDGTGRRRLTWYPTDDTTALWYEYHAGTPVVHPLAPSVSFQSKKDGKYSLYSVDLNTLTEKKLTHIKMEEGWHRWSPDGQWLVIEVFDPDETKFNIGLLEFASGSFSILTDSTYIYQQAPFFIRTAMN